MKRKKLIAILLAIMLMATVTVYIGCNEPSQEPLSVAAQKFVDEVKNLNIVTIGSKDTLDRADSLYAALGKDDVSIEPVVKAKARLEVCHGEYAELEAIAEENRIVAMFINSVAEISQALGQLTQDNRSTIEYALNLYETELSEASQSLTAVRNGYNLVSIALNLIDELTAEEDALWFIEAISKLPDQITLEQSDDIKELMDLYSLLSDAAKRYPMFAHAQLKYDNVCKAFKALDDQDKAEKFIAAAKDGAIKTVTLGSKVAIEAAEAAYALLSEEAAKTEGVAEGKAALDDARKRYDEIFAADQVICVKAFLDSVKLLPAVDQVVLGSYQVVNAAFDAYNKLSTDSQKLTEVEAAYLIFDEVYKVFVAGKYEQLKIVNPNLLMSGTSSLVLQLDTNMYQSLYSYYPGTNSGVSLVGKVKAWLHVYTSGSSEPAGRVEIDIGRIGREISSDMLRNALSEVAKTNPAVVSDAFFAFSLSFDDLTGKFIPSTPFAKSPERAYNFEMPA